MTRPTDGMQPAPVAACGYVVLASPDLAAWRTFADAIGVQLAPDSSDDVLYVRVDDRAFRVCVERGAIGVNNGVHAVGWEVAGERALDRVAAALERAGVEAVEDAALARRRRVARLLRCVDPGGNRLEFFTGALSPAAPFVSASGMRFVTGHAFPGDLGFGHVVTTYEDDAAARRFYMDVLGFRLTDVAIADSRWYFLRVNPRHHSLAFANYRGPSVYHHFMLELETLDMVGICHDRLTALKAPFTTTLGRHNNDLMVSFYVRTPSGIEVEIGAHARLVHGDDNVVTTYEGAKIWGHHRLDG